MNRIVPIENLSGDGELYDGKQVLGRVSYVVLVSRNMVSDGRGGYIPGLRNIAGHLTQASAVDLYPLYAKGAELILQLEDGRKWECLLEDPEGKLANRGELA